MRATAQYLGRTLAGIALLAAVGCPATWAYAPEPDLLQTKGYSPEVIQTMQIQRSRNEWREPPAATRTPAQQFWHNVYYNNWTGTLDEFGRNIIRPDS